MAASDLISDTLGFGGAERQAGRHREKLGRLDFVFLEDVDSAFFLPNAGDSASFRWQEFSV